MTRAGGWLGATSDRIDTTRAIETFLQSSTEPSRVVVTNTAGQLTSSVVSLAELALLDGIESNVQTQITDNREEIYGTPVNTSLIVAGNTHTTVKSALAEITTLDESVYGVPVDRTMTLGSTTHASVKAAIVAIQSDLNAINTTVDSSIDSSSSNPVSNSVIASALGDKQDNLTYDNNPTNAGSGVMTSGRIHAALQNYATTTTTNALNTAIGLKQDTLSYDSAPTESSSAMVNSGVVFTALSSKLNTSTFTTFQNGLGDAATKAMHTGDLNSATAPSDHDSCSSALAVHSALAQKQDTLNLITQNGTNPANASVRIAKEIHIGSSSTGVAAAFASVKWLKDVSAGKDCQLRIGVGNASDANVLFDYLTPSLLFRSDTTTRMKLTDDGKLAINHTVPACNLDVNGDARVQGDLWINGSTDNSAPRIRISSSSAASYMDWDGTSSSLIFRYDTTEKMRLTNQGRLGIGTNSPDNSLHVNGTAQVTRLGCNTDGKPLETSGFSNVFPLSVKTNGNGNGQASTADCIVVCDSASSTVKQTALKIGVNSATTNSEYAYIQATRESKYHATLKLNPLGGGVTLPSLTATGSVDAGSFLKNGTQIRGSFVIALEESTGATTATGGGYQWSVGNGTVGNIGFALPRACRLVSFGISSEGQIAFRILVSKNTENGFGFIGQNAYNIAPGSSYPKAYTYSGNFVDANGNDTAVSFNMGDRFDIQTITLINPTSRVNADVRILLMFDYEF